MVSNKSNPSKYFPEFQASISEHIKDKTIAITGCTSGTGLITAKTCAKYGAKTILMLNRFSERSKKAENEVKALASKSTNVVSIACDLQDFTSVEAAMKEIKINYDSLDILCNNAGVMALEDYATKDGYDVQMQTNHLSHFKITKELFPLLLNSAETHGEARIVSHSSLVRVGSPLKAKYFGQNGGNLGGNGNSVLGGGRWERYHQSKLANGVFAAALADKVHSTKVKSVCAAPGWSSTNLQKTSNASGGMGAFGAVMTKISQSAEDGTMPLLTACFSPNMENGDFVEPSLRFHMSGPVKKFSLGKHAKSFIQKKMLWDESEKACGEFVVV